MPNPRKTRRVARQRHIGVAVFNTAQVRGEVTIQDIPTRPKTVKITAFFTALPKGKHGFHIHKAGDLRGEGCKGACAHYHVGPHADHGGAPSKTHKRSRTRHTGDLGNISGPKFKKTYYIHNTSVNDLWGRSIIVHADEDDLGRGVHEDSKTTGHSGARIACAIIGRGTTTSCT